MGKKVKVENPINIFHLFNKDLIPLFNILNVVCVDKMLIFCRVLWGLIYSARGRCYLVKSHVVTESRASLLSLSSLATSGGAAVDNCLE